MKAMYLMSWRGFSPLHSAEKREVVLRDEEYTDLHLEGCSGPNVHPLQAIAWKYRKLTVEEAVRLAKEEGVGWEPAALEWIQSCLKCQP